MYTAPLKKTTEFTKVGRWRKQNKQLRQIKIKVIKLEKIKKEENT